MDVKWIIFNSTENDKWRAYRGRIDKYILEVNNTDNHTLSATSEEEWDWTVYEVKDNETIDDDLTHSESITWGTEATFDKAKETCIRNCLCIMRTPNVQVKLSKEDGNIFSILARATKELRRAGLKDKADEMADRVTSAKSYDEALVIVAEYVEVH